MDKAELLKHLHPLQESTNREIAALATVIVQLVEALWLAEHPLDAMPTPESAPIQP